MSTRTAIRVVIADDHDLIRAGMRATLAAETGIEVVGEAFDGDGAVATTLAARPDALLLDVEMPGVPVLSSIARVLTESPGTRVIVMTMHRDRVFAEHLIDAGASRCIPKSATSAELIAAVHQMAPVDSASGRSARTRAPGKSVLSRREREVMRLISEGLSNEAISQKLSISVSTVKRHNTHIYAKLGASSRTDAVRRAWTLGEFADAQR